MRGRILFFVYIISAILLGYSMPAIPVLKPSIPWLLGLSLYFYFLYLSLRGNLRMHWPILIQSSLYRYILMPIIVYLLLIPWAETGMLAGIIMMSAAPTALGSVLIIQRSGLKTPIVALDIIVQNMLAVFTLPLLSLMLLRTRVDIADLGWLSLRLFSMIIIPYGTARLTRRMTPSWNWERWKPGFGILNGITIIFIIFVATNLAFGQIRQTGQTMLRPFLGMAALGLFNYGIGFLLGVWKQRSTPAPDTHPLTLSVCFGYRNTSLMIWIALTFFSPESSIFPVFYIIVQHILNACLLARHTPPTH